MVSQQQQACCAQQQRYDQCDRQYWCGAFHGLSVLRLEKPRSCRINSLSYQELRRLSKAHKLPHDRLHRVTSHIR